MDTWSVEGLLKEVASANPPYHALIDIGALITGLSNEEVARYLLRVGLKGMQGVVYLDDMDRKMIILRDNPKPIPLTQCGVPLHERFTFYDQVSVPSIQGMVNLYSHACGMAGSYNWNGH